MATRYERAAKEAEALRQRLRDKEAVIRKELRQADTTAKILLGSAALKLDDADLIARLRSQLSERDRERFDRARQIVAS